MAVRHALETLSGFGGEAHADDYGGSGFCIIWHNVTLVSIVACQDDKIIELQIPRFARDDKELEMALFGYAERCPGMGVHVALQVFLPGEFGMLADMFGGFEVQAAGVSGGGYETHFGG